MPGRFTYWMNVSVDLKIEQATGENGGGSWMRIDENLHREFNARARELKAMVQGRVVYEIMESFWPAAATDTSQSDVIREYGEIWTSIPKVLVSQSRTTAPHNTRVIGGDDVFDQLRQLRAETDGPIGVGGATLATSLLREHLLDELMLFTHPAILSSGRPLFDDYDRPLELELIEHQVYDQGVMLHRYAIVGPLPDA